MRLIVVLNLFAFVILNIQCASRGRPEGGPVDRTPPEIIFTFPGADSTGVKELEIIDIQFSERMDEASVENSIFISPPLKYETEWSGGDELEIYIEDTLLLDHTYVLTIGSGAKDSRNNRLKESFQFAFSTGDHIDRGRIAGKVFNVSPKDILYIYAYKLTNEDSLNPTEKKADFLSQPGEDGTFKLDYLSLGTYRVFVIEDQNKNLFLDADYERIGIPSRDVQLDSARLMFDPLSFQITKIDTIPPFVSGARSINNQKVIVRLSEPVNKIAGKNISITDTLRFDTLSIKSFVPNKDEENQYIIYTSKQDSAKGYKILIKDLIDTTGNLQLDAQIVNFVGIIEQDTNKFEILDILPKDSSNNLKLSSTINFKFSLPVDSVSIIKSFSCWEKENDLIRGKWHWPNLTDAIFKPEPDLLPGRQYFFKISTNNLTSLWGDSLSDTTITRTIFTISEDEFGSISGEFIGLKDASYDSYVSILPLSGGEGAKKILVSKTSTFKVDWLPEGRYKLGGFIDINANGKYSFGQLSPFQYSEPFYFGEDTIRVRKRWETAVRFSIPGLE